MSRSLRRTPRLQNTANRDDRSGLLATGNCLRATGNCSMQITEIYKSLQGESTHAGLPCVFVRLTGCNLRCSWCDSEYTFTGGRRMTSEDVFKEVKRLSPRGGLVEITGGEPMLQERELVPFMQRLVDAVYKVLIETSGERPLAGAP